MDQRQKSGGVGVLIALVLCVLVPGLYVVGYFALATYVSGPFGIQRNFPTRQIASVYYPLAFVEAKTTGREILVMGNDAGYFVQP